MTNLIERLEAAEVGSRELDVLMARAVGGTVIDGKFETVASWGNVAAVTTSVDAALALVAEKLPGWYRMVDGGRSHEVSLTDGSVPSAEVREDVSRFFATHDSEPIATILAVLKALEAQS